MSNLSEECVFNKDLLNRYQQLAEYIGLFMQAGKLNNINWNTKNLHISNYTNNGKVYYE